MLVDDHASFRATARWLLETEGYVRSSPRRRAARARSTWPSRRQPELVLLDVGLPGIDGFQVALAIRARCPRARIVLISSRDLRRPRRPDRVLACGAAGFVHKAELSRAALRRDRCAVARPPIFVRLTGRLSACAGYVVKGGTVAATATRTLKNFVNGEYVEPESGRYSDVVNPATGETYAQAPISSEQRRRPRLRRGLRRVRRVARLDAGRAPARAAALRRRDRVARRRVRRRRGREHRQAARAHGLGGDPADGRPDPLLRGRGARARRSLRRRVHARHDLVHPARADRRRRPGHALELPAADGDLEDRPGARGRQQRSCSSRATRRPPRRC